MTPASSLQHYARTVSPTNWKDVFLAMLTACFDGAGKETNKYNIVVVAGFASFAGLWEEFTRKWNQRIVKDGLTYFHAGDFAKSVGEFENGWKGNTTRREALASDLMQIISECGLRKFGCILRLH